MQSNYRSQLVPLLRNNDIFFSTSSKRAALPSLAVLAAMAVSGDVRRSAPTATELQVVKKFIAEFSHVVRDRYEARNSAYTWQLPALAPCRRHWGLPVSSPDPYTAVFLKSLYSTELLAVPEILSTALAQAVRSDRETTLKRGEEAPESPPPPTSSD